MTFIIVGLILLIKSWLRVTAGGSGLLGVPPAPGQGLWPVGGAPCRPLGGGGRDRLHPDTARVWLVSSLRARRLPWKAS